MQCTLPASSAAKSARSTGSISCAGQPVARLDDRLARAQLAAAEASLAQAQARHQLAVHERRRDDVAAARAKADAAAVEAHHRSADLARSERLGRSGALVASRQAAQGGAERLLELFAVVALGCSRSAPTP